MPNDGGLCAACWCQSRPRVTQLASQCAGAIPLRAHRSTMWPMPHTCGPSCRRAYETCWIRRGRAACSHHHAKAFGLETTRIAAGEPWHGWPPVASAPCRGAPLPHPHEVWAHPVGCCTQERWSTTTLRCSTSAADACAAGSGRQHALLVAGNMATLHTA